DSLLLELGVAHRQGSLSTQKVSHALFTRHVSWQGLELEQEQRLVALLQQVLLSQETLVIASVVRELGSLQKLILIYRIVVPYPGEQEASLVPISVAQSKCVAQKFLTLAGKQVNSDE
ncbi:hypothetical protein, partial [Halomonas sp. AOP42-D1-22]|uniref:hypothetical protein n=1 Tax=Halomonas sp. AOP42-D1-22 TaxID=3457667 RepID=UPI0040332DF3